MSLVVCVVALSGCQECTGSECAPTGGGSGGGTSTSGGGTGVTGGGVGGGNMSTGCQGSSEFVDNQQTWSGTRAVNCDVIVTGELTIAAGTRVELAADATIRVSPYGTLRVEGSAAQPVLFTRADATKAWGWLFIERAAATQEASIRYATFTGGGKDDLPLETSTRLSSTIHLTRENVVLDHVTIENSAGVGLAMDTVSLGAGSAALTVTGSASFPVFLCPSRAGSLPSGTYTGNGTDALLLGSAWLPRHTCQERVINDLTLANFGVPWQLGTGRQAANIVLDTVHSGESDLTRARPKLTILPGVRIQAAFIPVTPNAPEGSTTIRVNQGKPSGGAYVPLGAIEARGTTAQPIVFTSAKATPAAGDWQGFYFAGGLDARSNLEHVIIEFAGGESRTSSACETKPSAGFDADAAVVVLAEVSPGRSVITNSTIRDSKGSGIARVWQGGGEVDFVATNTVERVGWCMQTSVPPAVGVCTACQ